MSLIVIISVNNLEDESVYCPQKSALSGKTLYTSVVRLRTLKHKKSILHVC